MFILMLIQVPSQVFSKKRKKVMFRNNMQHLQASLHVYGSTGYRILNKEEKTNNTWHITIDNYCYCYGHLLYSLDCSLLQYFVSACIVSVTVLII